MKKGSILFCALFFASSVLAAPISYDFSGTLSSINDTNNTLAAYNLSAGVSTFEGSFTYDPETTLSSGDTTTAANYRNESAFELSITIDDQWNFIETDPQVEVRNDTAVGGGDKIGFEYHTANAPYGSPEEYDFPIIARYFFNIQFQDQTGIALSDTSLPESFDLDDYGFSHLYIGSYDHPYYITGRFDSLTLASELEPEPAPVPEPSTWILLGSGLAGLTIYRRKRK